MHDETLGYIVIFYSIVYYIKLPKHAKLCTLLFCVSRVECVDMYPVESMFLF